MKQTVTESMFCDAWDKMGRGSRLTYSARYALFRHLAEIEAETGEEIELDIIALCGEYAEYVSARDACREFGLPFEHTDEDGFALDEDGLEAACQDALSDSEYFVCALENGGVLVRTSA